MPQVRAGTYLVVDLRRNQFAARYLELSTDHLRWRVSSNLQLRVYANEVDQNDELVADLAFFRPHPSQRWKPIKADRLSSLDSTFERVSELFKASAETRREIAQRSIQSWLNVVAAATRGYGSGHALEVIYLVDDVVAAEEVRSWHKPAGADGQVYLVPPESGDMTGYALVEPSRATLLGAIAWLGVSPELAKSYKPRSFYWKGGQFEVHLEDQPPQGATQGWLVETTGQGETPATWSDPAEVERTGAAVYALVWQPYLVEQLAAEVNAWRNRCRRAQHALDRLSQLRQRLDILASSAPTA